MAESPRRIANAGCDSAVTSRLPGEVGSSDIIGLQKGTGAFIAIEVTQPGKQPTESPREFMEEVNRAGGLSFVASTLEDVAAQGL